MGPMTHAPWLGSCVFDGARAFEGVAPDLDLHCQRIVRSAESFGLKVVKNAGEIEELIREGIAKFPKSAELYLRPMFWAEDGFVDVDPESTQFSVSVYDAPMPKPTGFSVTCSPFRRPSFEYAPTDAKAACHYPNSARAIREAKSRGFDNAVMLDPLGNVAELATANIWFAKNGEAHTPVPNGTFLNGVTRQRVIKLLRKAGIKVHRALDPLERVPRGGRGVLDRQLRQGGAHHPRRAEEPAARPRHAEGARTLLGLCAERAVRRHGLRMKGVPSKASAPRPIFSIGSHHAALAAQHVIRQRDDEPVRRGGGRGRGAVRSASSSSSACGAEHAECGEGRRRGAADAGPAMDQHRRLARSTTGRRRSASRHRRRVGGVWPSMCCTMSWK